ncbi:hypothetical protein ACFUGD_03830, partial [Streptomyces sp. NPDC057217]
GRPSRLLLPSSAGGPAHDRPATARAWLAAPHAVKNTGATHPGIADAPQVRLAKSYDVVIHLQRVEAAHMLE